MKDLNLSQCGFAEFEPDADAISLSRWKHCIIALLFDVPDFTVFESLLVFNVVLYQCWLRHIIIEIQK